MPFFRFHFVEASELAIIGRKLTDELQVAIGCPREHIVLEVIHSTAVESGEAVNSVQWPFIEVDYFERPKEIQDAVAKIIYDNLKEIGYAEADLHFRYLQGENYYENGQGYQ